MQSPKSLPRPFEDQRHVRDRAQHRLHLQGQARGRKCKDLGVRYVCGERTAQRQSGTGTCPLDAETALLWADQFDADRADLLQMQDEIVTGSARALEIKLGSR